MERGVGWPGAALAGGRSLPALRSSRLVGVPAGSSARWLGAWPPSRSPARVPVPVGAFLCWRMVACAWLAVGAARASPWRGPRWHAGMVLIVFPLLLAPAGVMSPASAGYIGAPPCRFSRLAFSVSPLVLFGVLVRFFVAFSSLVDSISVVFCCLLVYY